MKAFAPAAERNREPIADVLERWLPERGLVLEVASGSGQHAVHFARRFPSLSFQPTDTDPTAVASVEAWRQECALPNLLEPRLFDVQVGPWPPPLEEQPAVILAINLVHISPWEATVGLLRGAARTLPPGGLLYLYGPYFVDGVPTAPSNLAFDESLRSRNPSWGVRRLAEVENEAEKCGLGLADVVAMPANNTSLRFRPVVLFDE